MLKIKVLVVVIISVVIGVLVYSGARYSSATLVLHTKTLEKGVRQITVEGKDGNTVSHAGFEIGNDSGEPSVYSIELPRVRLKTIKIPPQPVLRK